MEVEGDKAQEQGRQIATANQGHSVTTPVDGAEVKESSKQTSFALEAKGNKKVVVIAAVVVVLLVALVVTRFFLRNDQGNRKTSGDLLPTSTAIPTTTQVNASPMPTVIVNLTELETISELDVSASIKVPFVREGNIYLYESGLERLVARPSRETTEDACFHLLYPLLSPSGEYIAYIEQVGDSPGYGGCTAGRLRIVDISASVVGVTDYRTSLFKMYSWNNQDQLLLEALLPGNEIKFVIYDPSSGAELVSETVGNADRDAGYRGFPIYSEQKAVRYKDNKYYLFNPSTGSETLLLEGEEVEDFRGWSPDGKYALFNTNKAAPEHERAFADVWYVVNTGNLSEPKKEVIVLHGAAGGDFSTGNKWYFDKAFVSYCSQYLTYLDGKKPLELTSEGGGGCHNEEGFVATSPNGGYAFVKFADRFELHDRGGGVQVVDESTLLSKGRSFPKNFMWLDNNNMIMFESTYGGSTYGGGTTPKVHLYNNQSNTLRLLIDNAYLIESSD
jgi:hypothetical protein